MLFCELAGNVACSLSRVKRNDLAAALPYLIGSLRNLRRGTFKTEV